MLVSAFLRLRSHVIELNEQNTELLDFDPRLPVLQIPKDR